MFYTLAASLSSSDLDRSRSTLPFLSKLKWGDVECIVTLSNNEGETATRTNCKIGLGLFAIELFLLLWILFLDAVHI